MSRDGHLLDSATADFFLGGYGQLEGMHHGSDEEEHRMRYFDGVISLAESLELEVSPGLDIL